MIVGLCGQAGSGKSTAAQFLVRDHGFVEVALADVLKRACKEFFQFTNEQLWGPSEKRNEPDKRYPRILPDGHTTWLTPRHALQQLGTEFRRSTYPHIWIEYALRIAKTLLYKDYQRNQEIQRYDRVRGLYVPQQALGYTGHAEYDRLPAGVVISDCRFREEVGVLRENGSSLWRITRPGNTGLTGEAAQHASETEQKQFSLELFDCCIENGGSMEALSQVVDSSLAFTKTLLLAKQK